ncbi:hypothetical protein C8R44DRAFT_99178 [Mycena epipterygia]|nr:hypothetical protein C8R44DRAFT_99178 [Mycena epipterygia]
MSSLTRTTTTTTAASRPSVWRSLSFDIAELVGAKTRSASKQNRRPSLPITPSHPSITVPAGTHRRMSASTLRPALKRTSTDFSTRPRCESTRLVPSFSAPTFQLELPVGSFEGEIFSECTISPPPAPKGNPCQKLLHRIHIFASSPSSPASRVFPDLPPPLEWDEVSLAIESDSSDSEDDQASEPPAAERKVRFMVPAPPPPPVEENWDEEPAWSDFM